jgi:hypothetical protein
MSKYFVPTARPARVRAARLAGDDYGVTARPDWRTIDWASHLHELEIDGRPVNYVDLGSGAQEPIVFVHGSAASGRTGSRTCRARHRSGA